MCPQGGWGSSELSADRERLVAGEADWRARKCQTCHSVYGLGGHMGMDLTNVIRDRGPDFRLTEPHQVYADAIRPWLHGFPAFGLLLLVGLSVLGFQFLRALVGPCAEFDTEPESEEPERDLDTGRCMISGEGAKGGDRQAK